ncbi:oligopeptide transporter [Laccaria bicolor S238N-H82]|uniref:Oligopeptide transporter n=1 Tax=Laccaria bicolor (strain S238N-H82 / ATCC MYA-4686) TaxID=486041 RepID=B0DJL8_LACBS|nr:oligopeptide transporter [Laccaria bicolor S238N-H82]EDR05142.1 oligopeptide transporter [Laccaria bicolor S238N-H82]|eukprot:XP_001884107.1 oligopeptide transporter [Laccaria bicolor S238N-H82]
MSAFWSYVSFSVLGSKYPSTSHVRKRIAILVLSWAYTAVSTFGRLYGSSTSKLLAHLPILRLPLALCKSLAGFTATFIRGALVAVRFWGLVALFPNGGRDLTWALDGPTSTRKRLSHASLDDSPYPEVQSTVANTDDPDIPVNTIHAWVLALIWAIIVPGLNQFFFFRYPSVQVTAIVAQLLIFPMGRLWARIVPNVKIFGFELNPGPFSMKEHVLATIMASVGAGSAYVTDIVAVKKVFSNQTYNFSYQWMIVMSTQLIGFSIGGITRRFLYMNAWSSKYMPIINADSTFNEVEYKAYSPLFLSTTFAISYGLSFASIMATLPHAFPYFRKTNVYTGWWCPHRGTTPRWWWVGRVGSIGLVAGAQGELGNRPQVPPQLRRNPWTLPLPPRNTDTNLNLGHPNRIQAEDSRVVWQKYGAPHPAHLLPSNLPLESLDHLRDAHAHRRLCPDMAFSFQILQPTGYEQPHVVYRHQDPDTTIRSSNAYGILIVIFLFPLTAYQGIVNRKSRRLSPDRRSAVARVMLNARRSGRLTGGGDCVECVR